MCAFGLGVFITVFPTKAIAQPQYNNDDEKPIEIDYERGQQAYSNWQSESKKKSFKSYPPKPLSQGTSSELENQLLKRAYNLGNDTLSSCVQTAKAITGINFGSIGKARNLKPNSALPSVGAIIILDENAPGTNSGHLGTVLKVWADTIEIVEGNYYKGRLSFRELKRDYNKIIGYWVIK